MCRIKNRKIENSPLWVPSWEYLMFNEYYAICSSFNIKTNKWENRSKQSGDRDDSFMFYDEARATTIRITPSFTFAFKYGLKNIFKI